MKFDRSSGILIHPSSFPGRFGIGDLGPEAFSFLDFLKEAGCKLWQILPLGPTGYGDSPYQSFSAFAGNPYLISPELLLQEKLLHSDDLIEETHFSNLRVEFAKIIPWKLNLLERAYINFIKVQTLHVEYGKFCIENEYWLEDYSLFMAIKESHEGCSWTDFPGLLPTRDLKNLDAARANYSHAIDRFKFYQFIFFKQWNSLKDYAHKLNIKIIGDLPLYVAHDSADVWANPDLFQLDANGHPTFVAGVPPDYFSSTGQLWGNPIYKWEKHKENGFIWWGERIKQILEMVDIIRLDHFRGFLGYWQVPVYQKTAEQGMWEQGPGFDFFKKISRGLNSEFDLPFIAEDLGVITPDVVKLRDHFKIPGMKILQFAFSSPDNSFLPHHFPGKCVVYTGTHDNDTSEGWFDNAPDVEKKFAKDYLGEGEGTISWDLIRGAWASVAVYAIAPMQDVLSLGSSARMNYPGRIGGNWEWRMPDNYKESGCMDLLKKFNYSYGRR
jgi:4-alpha-glucanotransferase